MMKTLRAASAAIALTATTPALANLADVAGITTIVESVATLADRGEFEALERLYASEVRVDYTSLSGGEPEVKSASALITQWASLLPGFDRTRHRVYNIEVSLNGSAATATAQVVADHWLGAMHWQVSGRYDYALVRDGREWRITAHRFVLTSEHGSREIFGPAAAGAQQHPNAYLARQQSRQVVMNFLTGLEDKDMDRVNAVWAEDAVQDMPYSPPGHPKRVVGRQALVDLYRNWPTLSGRARFTDGIRFYPTLDPQIVFVEFHGEVYIIPTNRTYRQTYGGLFHVKNGKVVLFREYYDPAPFVYAFALNEGGAFQQQ
jgi:ketosteroid isomerase-like protein